MRKTSVPEKLHRTNLRSQLENCSAEPRGGSRGARAPPDGRFEPAEEKPVPRGGEPGTQTGFGKIHGRRSAHARADTASREVSMVDGRGNLPF